MELLKNLCAKKGIEMIESVLEVKQNELPEDKSIKDFGGGYVECLKTKANVVLYFGFDKSNNRVSLKFQINRNEVLLWQEAISEKIWNKEKNSDEIIAFGIIDKPININDDESPFTNT
ncbi:MAG: hypothetical protein K8R39_11865 [Arcobacteraceae bacterium]|nr:hypothetical protein [Arcobacteraceae bacterium]